MLKGKVKLVLGWSLGRVLNTLPCTVEVQQRWGLMPPRAAHSPAHTAAFPAVGKPLFPLATAHPSSPLCRPALSQPRTRLLRAAHITAVNAFPPGTYFGHGTVGCRPLQALWSVL